MAKDVTGMDGMSQGDLEQLVRDECARLRAAWFPVEKPAWLTAEQWAACQPDLRMGRHERKLRVYQQY